ncbi:hypothetical protein JKA74_17525 [Marivirga sp. S37H4]|uniref:Uncharacterized protein n=2 Tax=Marivirga aurantiaca TaxID=2802615 RepID=A0A935CDF0_9BACT|nr:hypothetical protein [Marivirga aurantiaca]
MSDEMIQKYIALFNAKQTKEILSSIELSKYVEFLHFTPDKIGRGNILNKYNKSYKMYFIRNQTGQCIGAVLDMCEDLHWYILSKYRKKGHLTRAMKEDILPHLFTKNRNNQSITISRGLGPKQYKASESVAVNLGFKIDKLEDCIIGNLSKDEFYKSIIKGELKNQYKTTECPKHQL